MDLIRTSGKTNAASSRRLTRRQALAGALITRVLGMDGYMNTPTPISRAYPSPIRPDHAWLRWARVFALESWWPPFWPQLELDWDKALSTMRRLRLDTLQANALTKWACYPTTLMRRHPELGSRDLLREAQEFSKRHGFRLILYSLFGSVLPASTLLSKTGKHGPALFKPMLQDSGRMPPGHLETVPAEFQTYPSEFAFGGERHLAQCVFASEDWLLSHITELAQRYDYDACWLDGIGAGETRLWNACTCQVCRQAYLDEFRRPMPVADNPDDPRLLELRRWVLRRLDGVLGRVAAAFTKNGSLPLIGNMEGGIRRASFYPPILRHFQGGLFEMPPDTTQLVLRLRLSRQVLGMAFHYPDGYDPWPRRVTSGWEVENKGLIIAGCGGTPYLAQPCKYYYDSGSDEPARRVFGFIEKHKDLLDGQEEFSRYAVATDAPFHPGAPGDQPVLGWFQALVDAHEPVTAAYFDQLEDPQALSRYPAWLLPNTEYVTDAALRALKAYVEQGGGLYLSCNAGRVNHDRAVREGGLLKELFDIVPWQPSREQILRRHQFESSYQGTRSRHISRSYELYLKVADSSAFGFPLPGEKIFPSLVSSQVPGDSWTVLAWVEPSDGKGTMLPALGVKLAGQGRMVFSTVAWELQYQERRDPHLGAWMSSLTRWLAGGASPVRVTAPRCLFCAINRAKQGWLLYLVNNSNDIQHRRREWEEMMKVWDRPHHIGPVELVIDHADSVKALYGPKPDRVQVGNRSLRVCYQDFQEHVVLLAR